MAVLKHLFWLTIAVFIVIVILAILPPAVHSCERYCAEAKAGRQSVQRDLTPELARLIMTSACPNGT